MGSKKFWVGSLSWPRRDNWTNKSSTMLAIIFPSHHLCAMEIFWGMCSRLVCAPRMPLLYLESYLLFHLSGKQWSDSCHIQICSLEPAGDNLGRDEVTKDVLLSPGARGGPAAPGRRVGAGSVPKPAAVKQAGLSLFMQEILYLHSSFLYSFCFVGWWLSCYSAISCR